MRIIYPEQLASSLVIGFALANEMGVDVTCATSEQNF